LKFDCLGTRNAPFSKSPGSPLAAMQNLEKKGKAAGGARIISKNYEKKKREIRKK
jgi:hypothetical protein